MLEDKIIPGTNEAYEDIEFLDVGEEEKRSDGSVVYDIKCRVKKRY